MRLYFQDGPIAGLDIPWFEDVQPCRIMQFPCSISVNPHHRIFYKVTEDFNDGRRVMVLASYEEIKLFRQKLCDNVIQDLEKDLQKQRREIIRHSFGLICCIGSTILNLFEAYRGEWFPIFWQILYSFFLVFIGCLIKIFILKRRKLRYALDGMQKIRTTDNPYQAEMLGDQVMAALKDSQCVGIPTLNKLMT